MLPRTSASDWLCLQGQTSLHHPRHCSKRPPPSPPAANRMENWGDTYEGLLYGPRRPLWPTNPPSTPLPPALPTMNHPPTPPATPLPLLWVVPPAASNAPTNPAPPTPTPSPLALRCPTPTAVPSSPSVPHPDPPLPIGAPPLTLSTPSSKPPPADIGKPP
ncbi:hypothetical protein E4T56_gene16571 [Termitomyces sp. T112]|nr:hypothetical protein E4T56_gene16571 [Termitomyces sp. T112]